MPAAPFNELPDRCVANGVADVFVLNSPGEDAGERMTKPTTIRIGTGAGFSSDRLEPAIDLARDGSLDYLIFETIGERTLAFGHRDRRANPDRGYNPQLAARMRAVLPHTHANGTRIVTNMGVANVAAAADVTIQIARDLGLDNFSVAEVHGDDVTHLITADTVLMDHGNQTVGALGRKLICANAYIGTDAILPALETGTNVVITGRVADPSLFLAPMVHSFGWSMDHDHQDSLDRFGQGTVIGHLMECGMQVTGGYFADPGLKEVPDLANCGYPIAEVSHDGDLIVTKLASSGGEVSSRTVREQLLYEVHDPTRYLTPDVTADFTGVQIEAVGRNRVRVTGGKGTKRPDQLKATLAFDGGFLGEAEISYAGPGARARAELAATILETRLERLIGANTERRIDLIGVNALHVTAQLVEHPGTSNSNRRPMRGAIDETVSDVRVRVAVRGDDREAVDLALWETEALLCCGPAGGGGYRGRVTPSVITHSALVPRDQIKSSIEVKSV